MENKEFIEVVSMASNQTVLLPIRHITAVVDCKDSTFIETGYNGKGKLTGITVDESYEQIKQKILN